MSSQSTPSSPCSFTRTVYRSTDVPKNDETFELPSPLKNAARSAAREIAAAGPPNRARVQQCIEEALREEMLVEMQKLAAREAGLEVNQ